MALPAVIIPCRAASPWVPAAKASARRDGAELVLEVSEAPDSTVGCAPSDGFADRVEAGLRAAWAMGADTALLLNDDAELERGALVALSEALRTASVVGATVWEWDRSAVQSAGIAVDRRTGRVRLDDRTPVEALEERAAVSGAALALSKAAWDAVGGFDRAYRFYMEDVAFCLAAGERGHRVVVARDAVVRHRGGGTRSSKSLGAAWHLGRSHALLGWALGGGPWERGRRLALIGARGLAWSARDVGLAGPGAFASGVVSAASAAARGRGARTLGGAGGPGDD